MGSRVLTVLMTVLVLSSPAGFGADSLAVQFGQTIPVQSTLDPISISDHAGWNSTLLVSYCLLIILASIAGGWLPSVFELTHTRMQTVISFVGGLMLGIGVLHMLPHAAHDLHSVDRVAQWVLLGVLAMFLLIRTFHFHHHGPLEISTATIDPPSHPTPVTMKRNQHGNHDHNHDHDHSGDHSHDHDHDHSHNQDHGRDHQSTSSLASIDPTRPHCHHAHELSWLGIAIGLSLHTLIDGIALAASVQAESRHPTPWSLFGLGTFLAVVLHKPLDAVSITSLMAASGWSKTARSVVNACFAMMCPAGALLFLMGARSLPGVQPMVVGGALAFSAGVFICISLSDLLPEMEFHAHNRARLTFSLLAGIGLAWGITLLEPAHLH